MLLKLPEPSTFCEILNKNLAEVILGMDSAWYYGKGFE